MRKLSSRKSGLTGRFFVRDTFLVIHKSALISEVKTEGKFLHPVLHPDVYTI